MRAVLLVDVFFWTFVLLKVFWGMEASWLWLCFPPALYAATCGFVCLMAARERRRREQALKDFFRRR